MSELQTRYTVRNQNPEEIIAIIEPWAEEFTVRPGSTLLVTISHESMGLLEIVTGPGWLTIWLWSGCRAKVCLDDKDQTPGSMSIPAP